MCREYTAVKINAWTLRRRPVSGSSRYPRYPKSTCSSAPGSPSATLTVVDFARYPHTSVAKRCNVRYGALHPWRSNSSWIFTSVNALPSAHPFPDTQPRIVSSHGTNASHDAP